MFLLRKRWRVLYVLFLLIFVALPAYSDNESTVEVVVSDWEGSLELIIPMKMAYVMGDVNNDGTVDVVDVVAVVNFILQKPTGTFIIEAADVNKDATIDVSDVVGIVNIILGKQ